MSAGVVLAPRFEDEPALVLDRELCERARQTRDARFDGRFFIGVVTTGIYCRPICPVRPPKPENVRFYASAAAAAEAGLRPCLRCRPESSPGTSAWIGTAATVSRALRLIHDGALDEDGVDALASRLGIGARHLDRLFLRHLGASPLRVAQTRRVHLAKKLLDETRLPITEVAQAAGFGSVRRFHESIRATYGRTPTVLRGTAGPAAAGAPIRLRLGYRPPFDWAALLRFFALRAIPGVEQVDGDTYRRCLSVAGQLGRIAVRPARDGHQLELSVLFPDAASVLLRLIARVRRAFDLDADPLAIAQQLARDTALASCVRARPGLRVPGAFDGFEIAVRAVLGQQVSVKGARTLASRIASRFGRRLPGDHDTDVCLAFPTPESLCDADVERIGLPGARAETIRRLACAVRAGTLDLDTPREPGAFLEEMCRIPGIGAWTAQYVALRALGDPDAFPASDLGLRAAAGLCFGDSVTRPSALALERRAEAWRPWRGYAAQHLWSLWSERAAPPTLRRATRGARAAPVRVNASPAPRSARASAPSRRS